MWGEGHCGGKESSTCVMNGPSAANNRLEAPCADPAIDAVIGFDRESWTPLLWSCTVRHMNGKGTETIRPG